VPFVDAIAKPLTFDGSRDESACGKDKATFDIVLYFAFHDHIDNLTAITNEMTDFTAEVTLFTPRALSDWNCCGTVHDLRLIHGDLRLESLYE
jgi:hypothetical protein